MSDAPSLPRSLPPLTGIRGVAAFWVVLHHVIFITGRYLPGSASLDWWYQGFRGVDLFFVLSGFVLMHAHAQDFPGRVTWAAWRRFAILRAMRVYPLNAAVLALIALLLIACPAYLQASRHQFPLLGLVQNALLITRWGPPEAGSWNGPTWSLSFEVLLYAVFPLLAARLAAKRSGRWFWCASALLLASQAAYLTATLYLSPTGYLTGRKALPRAAFAFAAGACLHRAVLMAPLSRSAARLTAAASVALIAIGAVLPAIGVITVIGFGGVIAICAHPRLLVNRVLTSWPCMQLGRLSFSLYLTHYTALQVAAWLLASGRIERGMAWPLVASAIAGAIILSALLHRLVELPSQGLARRMVRRDVWRHEGKVGGDMPSPPNPPSFMVVRARDEGAS